LGFNCNFTIGKNATRKNIQKVLIGAGISVGFYFANFQMVFHVEAKIVGHYITYLQYYPVSLISNSIMLYALATIFPPFFSHIRRMWMLGTRILIS
jgi:hypothetical protein